MMRSRLMSRAPDPIATEMNDHLILLAPVSACQDEIRMRICARGPVPGSAAPRLRSKTHARSLVIFWCMQCVPVVWFEFPWEPSRVMGIAASSASETRTPVRACCRPALCAP